MQTKLNKVLEHLHRVLSPGDGGPTDGQLLARFVAARDEASFTALMRRHGPMVWRLCLRVLRHAQDAEDAFQATFLVLACKAASILKRESVGSWLYGVAYRTALEARTVNVQRRAHERQVKDMPHPSVGPDEAQDWRPLLDRELNLLPQSYQAVIVACDLEGLSRKEAARLLGLTEGTLSSRLARGRRLLAKRLARYGLSLSGGALAMALSEGASAAVPASLMSGTVKAAVLAAAGRLTAVSSSVVFLTKGVLKTMFIAKLKLAVGAMVVVTALGVTGLAYRAAGQSAPAEGKPRSELEKLRRENELLKLNLEVVLEKVRAQEAELRALKTRAEGVRSMAFSPDGKTLITEGGGTVRLWDAATGKFIGTGTDGKVRLWDVATGKEVQTSGALARLGTVRIHRYDDKEELQRAVDSLEKAVKELREQLKKQESKTPR